MRVVIEWLYMCAGVFHNGSAAILQLGSISAAFSSPVYVPPREDGPGEERGLLSRTAAGNRAYLTVFPVKTVNTRCEMKPQKITAKLQHGLVTT